MDIEGTEALSRRERAIECEHISAAHRSHQETLSVRGGKADFVPRRDTHRRADGRRQGELTLARQCRFNRSPTRMTLLNRGILLTITISLHSIA
jgi:hypothetical protein